MNLKYSLSILFAIVLLSTGLRAELVYHQTVFGGLNTQYYPDDIPVTSSPDLSNVYLDEYTGAITMKKGSTKDNTTAFGGNLFIKNLYNYTKQDGTSYRVVNTSTSIFLETNGTYASLLAAQTAAARYDFTTAKDYIYGCNGDTVFKSSGTYYSSLTVANSTGVPTTATCMKYINNRMWYYGMPTTPSQLWYSELNDPDYVDTLNYLLINVSDGDYITGIYGFKGYIIVTKRFSTWQVQETSVGVFSVTQISGSIGCLYQTTMQTYKGDYPIWVSARGVELYDGTFNPISASIQKDVDTWWQLDTDARAAGVGQAIHDTAADWGKGSGVNIDTTTTSGSAVMEQDNVTVNMWSAYSGQTTDLRGMKLRQKFIPTEDCYGYQFLFYGSAGGGNWLSTIYNSNMSYILAQSTITWGASGTRGSTTTFSNALLLTKNNTYYLVFSSAPAYSGENSLYLYYISTSAYSYSRLEKCTTYGGNTWTDYDSSSSSIMGLFYLAPTSATYTTGISTASSWSSWGTFNVDDSIPSGSDIDYYVQTSTANDNRTTRPYIPVINGGTIATSVGGYIWVTSSFTRTSSTAEPRIDKITINYLTLTNVYYPVSIIYKDRYYLAVSTDIATQYNNVVYVYDKNGQWTRLSGNWSGACINNSILYTGDSTKGQVYLQDVDGVYTDDGVTYDAYYCTKVFDMREMGADLSILSKIWEEIWTRNNTESTGELDVSYRIDGSTDTYTALYSVPLNSPYGINVKKIQFPAFTKSKFMQLKFQRGSSTNAWNLKGISVPFLVEPRE